jgi:HEAT repeat protein
MSLFRLEPGHSDLARLRDEADLEALAAYLNDPESTRRLRRQAALYIASLKPGGGNAGMAGLRDPAIIPVLAPLLENETDPELRRMAAYGLRFTGDHAVEPMLLKALSDSDTATRIHAAMGLGLLRSRAAVDGLTKLLEDRACAGPAADALVEIRDERALGPLRGAASSARWWRRKRLGRAAATLEERVGLRAPESSPARSSPPAPRR